MKQFIAFVKKEFYHIFRDRRTMLILLVMPVVQIVLFGFAITNEVKNVQVAVLDPDNSEATRRVIGRVDASEYFIVARQARSASELEALIRRGEADMGLVFRPLFDKRVAHGEQAVQIVADATDPNMAVSRANYLTGIVSTACLEMGEGAAVQTAQDMARVTPTVKLLYNPQMRSAYSFVPGVMGLILMLICAMMTSISIVREKETGTMEILLVSPARPSLVILSKAVPYFALSIVNLATILLLSVYVLHVPVAGNVFGLVGVSLLFIFVALALGLLISSLVRTQVAAMLGSGLLLMMPTLLLSGMIFPLESMPALLQWISCVIPARWYIEFVRKVMIEGTPLYLALKEIVVLSVMAAVLLLVSLRLFRNRLD